MKNLREMKNSFLKMFLVDINLLRIFTKKIQRLIHKPVSNFPEQASLLVSFKILGM